MTRLCVFLDVQAYSTRSEDDQIRVQAWLVDLVERATLTAGLSNGHVSRQQQGDGCLLLIDSPLSLAETLAKLIVGFTENLNWINEPLRDSYRMRVRLAFDIGQVKRAANGYVGRSVVAAARLVNSAELRAALAGSPGSSIAVAISNNLYVEASEARPFAPLARLFSRTVIHEKEYIGWAFIAAFGPGRDKPQGWVAG